MSTLPPSVASSRKKTSHSSSRYNVDFKPSSSPSFSLNQNPVVQHQKKPPSSFYQQQNPQPANSNQNNRIQTTHNYYISKSEDTQYSVETFDSSNINYEKEKQKHHQFSNEKPNSSSSSRQKNKHNVDPYSSTSNKKNDYKKSNSSSSKNRGDSYYGKRDQHSSTTSIEKRKKSGYMDKYDEQRKSSQVSYSFHTKIFKKYVTCQSTKFHMVLILLFFFCFFKRLFKIAHCFFSCHTFFFFVAPGLCLSNQKVFKDLFSCIRQYKLSFLSFWAKGKIIPSSLPRKILKKSFGVQKFLTKKKLFFLRQQNQTKKRLKMTKKMFFSFC